MRSHLPTSLADALRGAVAARRDELVQLTQTLVRERSVLGHEEGAQRIVAERLERLGFEVARVDVAANLGADDPATGLPLVSYEGRPCVAGRLRGEGTGRSLHLSGHVDVVPVEAEERWSVDPWGGEVKDGRLWGRGSGDMKAGVAAYLIAIEAYLDVLDALPGDVVFSSVIEEECTGNGMKAVLAAGYDADGTLIGEPSGLRLQHAGVGVVWARLTSAGSGSHPAFASESSTSTGTLLAALAALRELEGRVNEQGAAQAANAAFFDAFDKPFRLNVGELSGGVWPSSEPAALTARVRLGFGRDTTPAQAQELLRAAVHAVAPQIEVTFEGFRAPAYCDDLRHPLADALRGAHRTLHGEDPGLRVLAGTTDARSVTGPCICYGPQAGAIHSIDEWVDLDSTQAVAEAVALTLAAWQS